MARSVFYRLYALEMSSTIYYINRVTLYEILEMQFALNFAVLMILWVCKQGFLDLHVSFSATFIIVFYVLFFVPKVDNYDFFSLLYY